MMNSQYNNPQPYNDPNGNPYSQQQYIPNGYLNMNYQGYNPMPMNNPYLTQNSVLSGQLGRTTTNPESIMPHEIPMDGTTRYFPIVNEAGVCSKIVAKKWASDGTLETRFFVPDGDAGPAHTDRLESMYLFIKERFDQLEDLVGQRRYNNKNYKPKGERYESNADKPNA